jgi:hypothetical protein
MMNSNGKVIDDWLIATRDTIYQLQEWLMVLEGWQSNGRAEPDDFQEACGQLREAGLGEWAGRAGGHGLEALAEAVDATRDNSFAGEQTGYKEGMPPSIKMER